MTEHTEQDYKDEIARLHAFILRVAERLFLAAEVLSIRAEKKERRREPAGSGR